MTRSVRLAIFAAAGTVLAALLLWSLAGLPDFGHYHWPYGKLLNAVVVNERHTTNVVGAVVFDYRGVDTLGEEFILFSAVLGVALLLRRDRGSKDQIGDDVRNDALRFLGFLAVPAIFVLGLWVVAFGYVTPGGGFQGGVVLAAAFLLVYLVGGFRSYRTLAPDEVVDFAESAGAGAFALFGFVGLAYESAYLRNFLGIGDTGTLYAGGSIALVNWATAIEVCAAMVLLFSEFLEAYVTPASRWRGR
jgi:multicomponent Na+:H+ antiporter subunit B